MEVICRSDTYLGTEITRSISQVGNEATLSRPILTGEVQELTCCKQHCNLCRRKVNTLTVQQEFNKGSNTSPQLSSLRAESARAFTGRQNSHSGRGEDFLSRQQNFFTETALTPERKVEKSFPRSEINRHAEG